MKLPSLNIKNLSKPKESKLFLAVLPVLKEEKTKKFTTLSLSFITIAFFGLFAISPTVGTISDLQKQLDDNTFVHQQLQTKIQNLTTLQTKYADVQSRLDPVYAALPTSPAFDIFSGEVHQLAVTSGVQLNRLQTFPIDIAPIPAATKYLAYAFSIEAQGDLPSVQRFITQLATIDRLMTFDGIDYNRTGRLDPTFRAIIRGKTYFKSQ